MSSLDGIWKGFYEFGNGYSLPYFGERVKFQFKLAFDEESNFLGECKEEDSDFSIKHQSLLKGFIENQTVSFVKTYPVWSEILEAGSLEIKELSKEMEVFYEGYFDENQMIMYGSWDITQFVEDDELGEMEWTSSGIWLAKRV